MSIVPVTLDQLIAQYEAELAAMPSLEEIEAMSPKNIDEAIEKTRLRGKRMATERILNALKGRRPKGEE